MADILRSWHCQNAQCQKTFDAWDANPSCPACGCVRVSWVPGGGHIKGSSTKGADAELRALADIFRMDNMNSAERGRAAKVVATPPPAAAGPLHTFAPGFAAPVDLRAGASCVPSAAHVDFKVKATPGSRLAPNGSFPSVASNTSIEAVHKS